MKSCNPARAIKGGCTLENLQIYNDLPLKSPGKYFFFYIFLYFREDGGRNDLDGKYDVAKRISTVIQMKECRIKDAMNF